MKRKDMIFNFSRTSHKVSLLTNADQRKSPEEIVRGIPLVNFKVYTHP